MNSEFFQQTRVKLVNKIIAASPQLLNKYPVETLIRLIENQPSGEDYSYINKATRRFNRSLNGILKENKTVIGLYYNLLLLNLITRSAEKLALPNFPDEVVKEINQKFERIVKKIDNWSDNIIYQPLENDKYLKDLALCRMKLIPVGPQYIEIGKISRRFLFTGGIKQFFPRMMFVLQHGGFSRYYKLTTNQLDPDLVGQFSPSGWDKLLLCVAKLLKKNQHIKGVIGTSWFFDPQLETIDPDIAYIREKLVSQGGRLFQHRTDAHTIRDAIFMNNKRKSLYQKNLYKPSNYMMILLRNEFLRNMGEMN